MKSLTVDHMKRGFLELDSLLPRRLTLIVGGGGAMMLAHGFPLATADVDAVPKGMSFDELSPFVAEVARKLHLPGDWLNPWFGSFTHVLPLDYLSRVIEVFAASQLKVLALGKEDLLLMKCFAHRLKDVPHARALIRAGADVQLVRRRIDELAANKLPETEKAHDFLDECIDLEMG